MTKLTHRRPQPEIMDCPDLEESAHRQALRGLERINWFSRSAGLLWLPICRLARERNLRHLRVLDVACGSADVAIGLITRAAKAGLHLEVTGIDKSDVALARAATLAERRGLPLTLKQQNVFTEPLPGDYDVVTTSLFLHHLEDEQVVELLQRMAAATHHLLLINDLRRSVAGVWLAHMACRLLTRSSVVHYDGPLSIKNAFTPEELEQLHRQAGLTGIHMRRYWPFRLLVEWRSGSY